MIRRGPGVLALLLVPALLAAQKVRAQDRSPVVHALLFYSPTCPHCEELINNRLPPLLQRYGKSLDVVGINVATQSGLKLYESAVDWYLIGPSRQGVPTLIVGTHILVGEVEIPAVLPQIVDSALARGGIDWPEMPAIRQALQTSGLIDTQPPGAEPARDSAQQDSAAARDSAARADSSAIAAAAARPGTDTAAAPVADRGSAGLRVDTAASAEAAPAPADTVPEVVPGLPRVLDTDALPLTMADRFRLDPVGNATAVAVLLVMTGILVLVGFGVRSPRFRPSPPPGWMVPVLAIAGMAVAAYLAFIEVTGTEAICGPVGDCNTVQQSEYARLFGVLPVGLLGLAGYAAILVSWLVALRAEGVMRRIARMLAWGMALAATLFSMYLTFLEPFVIGATCAWCLTSAVIASLVLLVTTPAAVPELRRGHSAPR